ncbi:MAG: HAMP domain-containing histidine kinase [Gemmatimonadales bacterium]|nr:HAMP domain-containing histidine kinase [Gemmatimonadales bacterium]MDQ3426533.1 HAMP domain-containing histidine kinase [Gemmatimonadota bacterium]
MRPETALPGATSGERRRAPSVVAGRVPVWDPAGPTTTAIAAPLWDALRESVLWAAEAWERALEHAAGMEEVTAHVAQACTAIRQQACGHPPELDPGTRNALSRRVVGLIRGAFLERVQALPPPDSGQLLRLLSAIEQVGRRLESDWSEHFADRLSAPDGLELVVEVAHDLRSPLTSILFLAETLQRGRSGVVNVVQERQLGLIYSAAFGLSSVASDVIELARGGDRLVDLDPIPFSVTDILESVRDIVQPIAEEKNLTVRLVPPEADFRTGHPVALSRVLLNLTTNALKFTAEGFVEVTARQSAPRWIEFSVRDTGRGIPPQSMATLFEPFRRRQKQGEYAFSGSGLGLSICRKLVEAMGSTLQVETELGTGTRFFFELDLPLAGEGNLG